MTRNEAIRVFLTGAKIHEGGHNMPVIYKDDNAILALQRLNISWDDQLILLRNRELVFREMTTHMLRGLL